MRSNASFDMYTQNGYDNREETIKELQNVGRQYIDEQKRFMNYVLKGKQIRIWYSNSPSDMCGFYYMCNIQESHYILECNDFSIFYLNVNEY